MLIELFFVFLQLGLFGIGGGLVGVSLLMQQVVIERQWLSATAFNDLIAIAESTPGPIVLNCATFVGMQLGGIPGAMMATVGAVIPGFMIALSISLLYQRYRTLSPIQGAMDGIRPIVIGLIFVGGFKVTRNALFTGGVVSLGGLDWFSAVLFVLTFFVLRQRRFNPVAVIVGGGILGGVIRLILQI